MRTIPTDLQTLLDTGVSDLVFLLNVRRRMDGGGGGVRYAQAQHPLDVDGDTYFGAQGIKVSSIPLALNAGEQTVTFEIAVFSDEENSSALDYAELLSGRYDNGEVTISCCSQGHPEYGKVDLWRGFVGQVEISDLGIARFTCFDLWGKGREVPIEHCEPRCRVDFGSPRCGASVPTTDTTVSSVSGFNVVVGSVPSSARLGLIVPTSGDSVGEAFEIREVSGTTLKTYIPVGSKLAPGDAVTIRAGCDKTLAGPQGCKFWDNVLNFQAEPHVPTSDTTDIHYETWGG